MNSEEAYEDVYRRHVGAVYRTCLRAVSRADVAEEIASEVFLELYKHWGTVQEDSMQAWLLTVARRRCADFWRRHYLEVSWLAQVAEGDTCQPPELSLSDMLARCPALKPVHRMCLTLRFAQGMSREEIAEHLNMSELQVKSSIQYALKLLRDQFSAAPAQTVRTVQHRA